MALTANFLNALALSGSSGKRNVDGKVAGYPAGPGRGPSGYTHLSSLTSYTPTGPTIDTSKETIVTDVVPGSSETARAKAQNTTARDQEVTVNLSQIVTNTTSNTVTTTSAVTAGLGFEASIEVGTPFATVGGKITGKLERTNANETSNTTASSTEKGFSVSAKVTVPPKHTYVAQLLYSQVRVTVPYTYDITIGGHVTYIPSNNDGNNPVESAGEVVYYDKYSNFTYPGINPNDLTTSFPGQPNFGEPYNTQPVNAHFKIPGNATFTNGYEAYILFTDQTPTSALLTSPEILDGGGAQVAAAAPSLSPAKTYYAPYNSTLGIGDNITLDASHTNVVGTPFADEIYAGPGNDAIDAGDGNNIVYGGSGDDVIMAEGNGVNTLIGGSGNTLFELQSSMSGNSIRGGQGADSIQISAPGTIVLAGPGNDNIQLDAKTSGGSEITDHVGINALTIGDNGGRLQFQQDGEGLIILFNGDKAFDAARDVVWTDFFESRSNSVNGLSAAFLANVTKDGAFDQGVGGLSNTHGGSHTHALSVAATASPVSTFFPTSLFDST